jgi:hypothetical protein
VLNCLHVDRISLSSLHHMFCGCSASPLSQYLVKIPRRDDAFRVAVVLWVQLLIKLELQTNQWLTFCLPLTFNFQTVYGFNPCFAWLWTFYILLLARRNCLLCPESGWNKWWKHSSWATSVDLGWCGSLAGVLSGDCGRAPSVAAEWECPASYHRPCSSHWRPVAAHHSQVSSMCMHSLKDYLRHWKHPF